MDPNRVDHDLELPGIYFLFGEDEDGAKPSVYIGTMIYGANTRKRLHAFGSGHLR